MEPADQLARAVVEHVDAEAVAAGRGSHELRRAREEARRIRGVAGDRAEPVQRRELGVPPREIGDDARRVEGGGDLRSEEPHRGEVAAIEPVAHDDEVVPDGGALVEAHRHGAGEAERDRGGARHLHSALLESPDEHPDLGAPVVGVRGAVRPNLAREGAPRAEHAQERRHLRVERVGHRRRRRRPLEADALHLRAKEERREPDRAQAVADALEDGGLAPLALDRRAERRDRLEARAPVRARGDVAGGGRARRARRRRRAARSRRRSPAGSASATSYSSGVGSPRSRRAYRSAVRARSSGAMSSNGSVPTSAALVRSVSAATSGARVEDLAVADDDGADGLERRGRGHPRPSPRRTRFSPTRSVTFSRSKYSASGMTCLRVAPTSSLNSCVVISRRSRRNATSRSRSAATAAASNQSSALDAHRRALRRAGASAPPARPPRAPPTSGWQLGEPRRREAALRERLGDLLLQRAGVGAGRGGVPPPAHVVALERRARRCLGELGEEALEEARVGDRREASRGAPRARRPPRAGAAAWKASTAARSRCGERAAATGPAT